MGVDLDDEHFEGGGRFRRGEVLLRDPHGAPFIARAKISQAKRRMAVELQLRQHLLYE